MKQHYFTFGFGHHHAGGSLNSCFTIIEAPDSQTARAIMYERRANKWSFQYETAKQAGVEKWNLRFIDFADITKQNGESY